MGIFDKFLGKQSSSAKEKGIYNLPVTGGMLDDGGILNWWQTGRNVEGYEGPTAIVHACVDAYAQTMASLYGDHYRYAEDGSKERVKNSALSRCLHQPNDYQTRSDFVLNLVKSILMDGNAYVLGQRNNRGEINSLHLLPSRGTEPYLEPETKEVFYAIGNNPFLGDVDVMIPSRDIMHIRLHTPAHPLIGVSPISNAASSIAANSAITNHQAAFFNNMSRPSGTLTTDMKLSGEQMRQLRNAWQDQSKQMNSGGIPILGSGIKWEPMSISSQDSQLIQAFQMTVEDVARAFRVPLPLVGDYRHSTYNNVEQLVSSWLATGLGFLLEHIEVCIDKFFQLPREQFTEFDVESLLRTDFSTRVDGYTKAIQQGLMTPNEARAKMGGLPSVEKGDVVYAQAQMRPLGEEAAVVIPEAPAPEPVAEIEQTEPEPEAAVDSDEERNTSVYYLKGLLNG